MKLSSVRSFILINIALGALAVVLGALGSHLPTEHVGPNNIDKFETAQRYHMVHVLAVLIQGGIMDNHGEGFALRISMSFTMLGILFFCGSLYAAFFFGFDHLNFLTPIGGCFLLVGWITFFLAFFKREKVV